MRSGADGMVQWAEELSMQTWQPMLAPLNPCQEGWIDLTKLQFNLALVM